MTRKSYFAHSEVQEPRACMLGPPDQASAVIGLAAMTRWCKNSKRLACSINSHLRVILKHVTVCAGVMPPARTILPYKKPNYTVQLQNHEIQVCNHPMLEVLQLLSCSYHYTEHRMCLQEDLEKVSRGSANGAAKRSNRRPVPSTQYLHSESPPHH